MIEITGLDEMRARLKMLDEGIRTQYVLNAVKAGAMVIKEAMVESAPVLDEKTEKSNSLEPGELKRDIKARTRMDKDGFAVSHIGPSKRTGYVARFLEFGHRLTKGKHGHQIGEVRPHPFLRAAFEASEAEAIDVFKATLRDEIAGGLK